ncbi:uncharacterized protein LOC123693464 isoform X2 [Colias croceus]|uniref:uncharacterized protein LOC123693464 isoform X2 n=1 Tax=Colias crocea TaxID=72248 RepID=UPI001E27EB38|nr:uncharacterized protein LOC123693464 isoform X2 [Colias croceus]
MQQKFPTNELKCHQWVKIVRKQRKEKFWKPNKSSKICSVHFKDEDKYTSDKGNIYLKNTAVPDLDLPNAQSISGRPNSLTQENSSDLESFFDTPQKAARIENDTDNFVQFKLVGGTLRIKPNINPHKFDCQKPYEECNRMERGQLLNKETHENTYIKKSPSDDELGGDKDESVSEPITISNPGAATNTHSVYIKRSPSDDEMEEDNNESKSTKKISITEPVDDGNLSDSDLSCSDVDEALESIKVSMMRKELKKRLELLKKTQNKVRALHKRNQRLSKKVASLKTIVNTYKEGKCCCHAKINDDSDSDSK